MLVWGQGSEPCERTHKGVRPLNIEDEGVGSRVVTPPKAITSSVYATLGTETFTCASTLAEPELTVGPLPGGALAIVSRVSRFRAQVGELYLQWVTTLFGVIQTLLIINHL